VKAGPSAAKLLLDVPFILEAALLVATGRFDVVHAVEEAAHLIAPVTRLLRVPLVADVDSCIPDQLRYSGFATRGPLLWAAEALERHALRRSAAVVTVCSSLSEGVRRRAPEARIFQIEDPPLVDGSVAPERALVASLRQALGLEPQPVVLYTGNFEPYQGVGLLVEAAALLPGTQFLFMGGEAPEIEVLRARLSPSGGRCLFAGKRPPSELPAFLALADVLVSPRTRGENTPFKIYTYLASGKPLVATRIASHTQLLDDTTSFLVEATAAGLAGGITSALADSEAAAARARRGRQLVEERYSAARYAGKVREAYDAVAAALGR
jgi:glycosyltransferase involved in cell wall biosynthesis